MTPHQIISSSSGARTVAAARPALLKVVRVLEAEALSAPPDSAWGVWQDSRLLTPTTLRIWTRLGATGAHVRLLARGMVPSTAPRLSGVPLADDDPVGDEWVVLFQGPRPVVLAAADLPYERWDGDRTFVYGVSRDPAIVSACRRVLASRAAGMIEPSPSPS